MTSAGAPTTGIQPQATRQTQPKTRRRQVGQWELVEWVAAGALADVYRARPAGCPPDRPALYAVKLLRPQWQDNPKAVMLMRREAAVGRRVCHPNLVSILAAGLREPPYYVVMPWLEGATLAHRLARCQRFDLPEVLWIARQVAEALAALHTDGWMHGDVKPSNIFLSPEGHATLLDLGFARRPDETGSAVDRCVMGTCAYLAPEMVTSALRADVRSDIYSLGAVLFEMLCGRPPFEAGTLAELVAQHRQARAPDLRRIVPQLPTGVVRLVREMLAKEPLRRPQTPCELAERLMRLEIATFGERTLP